MYDPNKSEHEVVTQTERGGLQGFRGIKRNQVARKQIDGQSGTSRTGSDSAPEAVNDIKRPSYATLFARKDQSFDGKEQQNIGKSMTGLSLTGAPIGSQPGNKYTKMPSNRSGSQRVGE